MKAVLAVLCLGLLASSSADRATAQDAPPPSVVNRPADEGADADAGTALGKPFESLGLGVALRPPADSKVIRQVGGTEVDFIQDKRKWNLRVARMALSQPMPLESGRDDQGAKKVGLLDVTLDKLKDDLPGAAVLRHDAVKVGEIQVGMIALRYLKGLETLLTQQAIVRASDQVYFTLTMTSPGSKAAGKEPGDDPAEAAAVAAFGEVLDTVRLLDQRPLVRDQEERLYATRALLVNFGGKGRLEKTLVPKQWFRLMRNGKDIGYVYTVEETAQGIPGDPIAQKQARNLPRRAAGGAAAPAPQGILIGSRSRTLGGENVRVDAESWMFCTPDRRIEEWSTLQVVQNMKTGEFDHMTTIGSSSRHTGRRLDRNANQQGLRGEGADPNQPPVHEVNDYVLDVTNVSMHENAEPLTQGLPEWYLPQALSHLLPRLLPPDQPKKYLFAVYVPDVRKVMHRYIDVGEEKRLKFNGETIRAVPISDRIGLEGSVTTHYVAPDGTYLGSENPDSGVLVLPSDEKTLTDLWKDADLTRPADVKRDVKPGAVGAVNGSTPGATSGAVPSAIPADGGRARLPAQEKPIRQRDK